MKKNNIETDQKVTYVAIEQAIRPLEPAILKAFDYIYNLVGDDSVQDDTYSLAELLSLASDVCFEVEEQHDKEKYAKKS